MTGNKNIIITVNSDILSSILNKSVEAKIVSFIKYMNYCTVI